MTWKSFSILILGFFYAAFNEVYAKPVDFTYEGYKLPSFRPTLTQKQIQKGIENNAPHALTAMGYLYYHGDNEVKQDYKQAIYWFRKASHLGDHEADYVIGYAHYYGLGVAENRQTSYRYFLKSARQGFPPALHYMAKLRLQGFTNIPNRCQDAVNWLYKASRSNFAVAQAQIADAFKQGICVRPNIKQARYYYNQALRNVKDDKIKSTILEHYSKL